MAMTSVSPEEIPLGEETTLTITGTGFDEYEVGGGSPVESVSLLLLWEATEFEIVNDTTMTATFLIDEAETLDTPYTLYLLPPGGVGEGIVDMLADAVAIVEGGGEEPIQPFQPIGAESGRYLQELTEQVPDEGDTPWLLRSNL